MDLARSDSLHRRVRRLVEAFEAGEREPSPATFDELACEIARYQYDHSLGFARLCRARGVDPATLADARAIPPVPTEAFKLTRVATFDPSETAATFQTSGTTVGDRGSHAFRDLATYDAAAVAFGRRWLVRDVVGRLPVAILHPSPATMPESSLGHMCARFVDAFGEEAPPSGTWFIDGEILDLSGLDDLVARSLTRSQPLLLLATSFALVHLLEALGDGAGAFTLPTGSRVMQTGGFKGKSREVPADELRRALARAFRIDPRAIVSEYGMTELSSQFYEATLLDPDAAPGVYVEPPWARVVPVDPGSLAPVGDGEVGLAKIVDLANVDSAVAVLTQDRVRRVRGGFELLGRITGAPPRGCSIAIEELLG